MSPVMYSPLKQTGIKGRYPTRLERDIDKVVKGLVEQPITADGLVNLLYASAVGNKFVHSGHVNSVDVRMSNRRCSRGKVDLGCPNVPCHLDDLRAGGPSDDGIIDQQHILPRNSCSMALSFLRTDFSLAPDRA